MLKGKIAVITGGGGVLCSAFAKELAKRGVKVALLDINKEAAGITAAEINSAGGEAIAVGADVLNAESLAKARQR